MASKTALGKDSTPDCSICRNAASVVRSIITEPLVTSVTTWVCQACYPMNKAVSDSLKLANRRLVVTEVAA